MYKIGTFSTPNEEGLPGIYTKISSSLESSSTTPSYGGVGLPCEIIYTKTDEYTKPIPITKDNFNGIMGDYRFRYHDALKKVISHIIKSANTAILYPAPVATTKDTLVTTNYTGYDETGNYSVIAKGEAGVSFATSNVLKITLTDKGDANNAIFQIYTHDGKGLLKEALNVAYTDITGGVEVTVSHANVEDIGKKYVKDKSVFKVTGKIKDILTKPVDIYLFGGLNPLWEDIKTGSNFVKDNDCNGHLIAISPGKDLTPGVKSSIAYLPTEIEATAGYAALLEIKSDQATLYYIRRDGERDAKDVIRHSQIPADLIGKKLIDLLRYLPFHKVSTVAADDYWADTSIPTGNECITIAFTSPYKLTKTGYENYNEQFTKFINQVGVSPASILFYPFLHTEDEYEPNNREACSKCYQTIQKTYIDKREELCSTTQLLLDETTWKNSIEWTKETTSLSLHSPYLISTAGSKTGGYDSLYVAAFIAGLMVKCDVTRNATALHYNGEANMQRYPQEIIERMYWEGIVTFHDHYSNDVIYIDRSTYLADKPTPENQEYALVFERNKTVRTINRFKYDIATTFFKHYFENTSYGDDVLQSLKYDIWRGLEDLYKLGALAKPELGDVTISKFSERSFTASVKMIMSDTVESIYITIAV